jgi:hypothetical protein
MRSACLLTGLALAFAVGCSGEGVETSVAAKLKHVNGTVDGIGAFAYNAPALQNPCFFRFGLTSQQTAYPGERIVPGGAVVDIDSALQLGFWLRLDGNDPMGRTFDLVALAGPPPVFSTHAYILRTGEDEPERYYLLEAGTLTLEADGPERFRGTFDLTFNDEIPELGMRRLTGTVYGDRSISTPTAPEPCND